MARADLVKINKVSGKVIEKMCQPSGSTPFRLVTLGADHVIVTPESAHELRRKRDLVALHLAAVEPARKTQTVISRIVAVSNR